MLLYYFNSSLLEEQFTSKSLKENPIWSVAWQKAKVNHLRVFGSDPYAHVPHDKRAKLDSKIHKCIMVGYENVTKGYRLCEAIQGKIFHSRDVQFNEQVKHQSEGVQVKSDYQLTSDFSEVPKADMGGHI